MKSMLLTAIKQMKMTEVETPKIQRDTDVLIKMQTVGICGSDVHYYLTGKIGSQVVQFPYPLGHEGAGVVAEVGSAVKSLKVGDRVAIEPAMPCFDCDQCKLGRIHTCRNLKFLACPGQADGCLSEYITMPATSCFKIKDSMTTEQAAISEPLAIGVYAVKQSIDIHQASVGILGAGPIGLSVLLPAKAQGAKEIFVTDKVNERIEIAKNAGALWAGNPDNQDIVAEILEIQPAGLDVVFDCCGQQEALDQAVELLKPGGKLVIIGIPTVDRISFSIDKFRRKEICVQNIRRQCHCVQTALDMIDNKDIDVDFMATHRFAFDDTQKAFDLVADYRDGVVKAMIHFD